MTAIVWIVWQWKWPNTPVACEQRLGTVVAPDLSAARRQAVDRYGAAVYVQSKASWDLGTADLSKLRKARGK